MLAPADAPFAFALFPSLFILADLSHQRVECVVDAHSGFGRCFDERHAILLSDLREKNLWMRKMFYEWF